MAWRSRQGRMGPYPEASGRRQEATEDPEMTTFAIEFIDLGFVLTLGACWAAFTLVALAITAVHPVVRPPHVTRTLTRERLT